MKIVLISKDADLIAPAKEAFEKTDELSVYGDWREALESSQDPELIIVDLLATLDTPHVIAGYERFAEAKMSHGSANKVPLVLISAPDDYDLDSMVGWPGFLHGLVKRPVTMKIFRRISTWV
jgi:hypothetical protein